MTPDEPERMMTLSEKITTETDHQKFFELILELSDLLKRMDQLQHSPRSA
jgi:hypothetical protein